MKKSLIFILTIVLCLSVSGFVIAGGMYYGGEFRSLQDTLLPSWLIEDFDVLEPGELAPGEYRLNLHGGRFGFDEKYVEVGYPDYTNDFHGNNFFIGLDLALENDLYLSVGYNTIPEFTPYYDDEKQSYSNLNLMLNYFLNDDTRIYGGYSKDKTEWKDYDDGVFDESETDTVDYFYLGTEIYGSFLK